MLAATSAAHLTVLHVYRDASIELHLHDTKKALEFFGKEIKERYGECRTEFRIGMPCEEIIKAAEDLRIDLVISSPPHHWLRRLACGSNEEELLRRVPCPVLLVHEDKHSSWSLN
jgi:nucleotide-binding universal stress UspA family protein